MIRPHPLVLIGLAAWCVGVARPDAARAQVAGAPSAGPVRVISYNIRFDARDDDPAWSVRGPHLTAQIQFLDPDVLGLQEALPHQVVEVAAALPDHDHYGVGRDDGAGAGETTTVFWRRDRFEAVDTQTLWCSPTPDRPSRGWDAALPRTVTRVILRERASGELLEVRNTHFDHVGAEARRRCAEMIAVLPPATLDGRTARRVVMGDFNAGPDSEPYRALIDAGLGDARAMSPVVFGPTGTYNAFDAARGQDAAAIDHVFVGTGLGVARFAVLTDSIGGKVISDHFPVVADLVLDRERHRR